MPALLLLKGLPCSGKSLLADTLSKRLGWPVIDKDDGRDCLGRLSNLPKEELNALSYEIMLSFAKRQVANGLSIVVDCPLSRQNLAERLAALARAHGAQIGVIECTMKDEACWQARLAARAHQEAETNRSHKPESWAALQSLIRGYQGSHLWTEGQPAQLPFTFEYLELDMSSMPAPAAADTVITWLQQQALLGPL